MNRKHRSRLKRPATATELAQLAKCEQQYLFDLIYGQRRTADARRKQAAGRREHDRYDRYVRTQATRQSSRCFIATAVYGPDAAATQRLRIFRDTRLCRSAIGRILIRLYERVSPPLARYLDRHPRQASAVRWILNHGVQPWI